jgi:hypothetical protein
MQIFQLFSKLIASLMVFLVAGMSLATGGATLNTLRNFDLRMGWLEPAAESLEITYKKVFTVDAQAQRAVFCVNCVNEGTFQAEKIFEKLLKSLVMNFVQGLLNFLKEQFLNILNQIEQWANTVFGLRLNLCYVKRFVSYQSALLYNSVEGQLNKTVFGGFVDSFEGEAGTQNAMNTAFADAGAALDFAAAAEVADRENPACASNDKLPSSDQMIDTIGESAEEMAQASQEFAETSLKAMNDGITEVLFDGLFQVNHSYGSKAETKAELANRKADVQENAEKAVEEIGDSAPSECKSGIYMASTSDLETGATGGQTANFSDMDFDGSKLNEASGTLPNYEAVPLTASQCDASNEVEATQNAIESTASVQAPGEGDLLDSLLSTVQDFFNQLFDRLKEIINQLIQKAIDTVVGAIQEFAGNFTGSVFGELGNSLGDITSSLDEVTGLVTREIDALDLDITI